MYYTWFGTKTSIFFDWHICLGFPKTWNQIVFTSFRWIWIQINRKMVNTIWFQVGLIRLLKNFSVSAVHFLYLKWKRTFLIGIFVSGSRSFGPWKEFTSWKSNPIKLPIKLLTKHEHKHHQTSLRSSFKEILLLLLFDQTDMKKNFEFNLSLDGIIKGVCLFDCT